MEVLHGANVRFCQDTRSLQNETIDVVSSVAVWMTLRTHEACLEYLHDQHRLLRLGGTAFVVVTHPCFREEHYSSFKTRFDNKSYLDEGTPFEVQVFGQDKSVQFVDFHWSLSTMLSQAKEVGFGLSGLTELSDAAGGNQRGAPWLCFKFRKD
jgi:hypothetical protein